jgi:hypothetical protein
MKEIPVDTVELEAKLYERINSRNKINNKTKVRRMVPALAFMLVLSLVIVFWYRNPANIPVITMKVSAAEQGTVNLSREFVAINTQAQPFFGGYTVDSQGNYTDADITYNINFICEGEGIASITYICSDQEITRSNRSEVAAYYVENVTLSTEEYKSLPPDKGDNFICGFYGEGEDTATNIYLIGSSYTVTYEEQQNIKYGLVVAATVDQEERFHCEDLRITARITMADGSEISKQLLLVFGEDAFKEVQIKILK